MRLDTETVYNILEKVYDNYDTIKWGTSEQFSYEQEAPKPEDISAFYTSIGKPDIFRDGNFNDDPKYYLLIEVSKKTMAIYYRLYTDNDTDYKNCRDLNSSFIGESSKFEHVDNGQIKKISAEDLFNKIYDQYMHIFYFDKESYKLEKYAVEGWEKPAFYQVEALIKLFLAK